MLPILAVALLLQLSACGAGDPCPPKSSLASCTCTRIHLKDEAPQKRHHRSVDVTPAPITANNTFYTVVECKVPKTVTALEETVSNALHRKLIDKLVVANLPAEKEHVLARLPSGWLKNARIKQFEIRDSVLSGDFIWYGNPFEGQGQTLLWLSAIRCSLTGALTYETAGTVHTKGLSVLPNVEGVDFSDNHLTIITSVSFRYPPANLSTIIMSRNSLEVIEGGAFQYAPLLTHTDLSHNLLQTLTRNIFASPARHLHHIDLSWNLLRNIPADFFSNMPALKSVNISNNFLYSLPEKPWGAVWKQLIFINITGNFVKCDCSLLWLLPILSPTTVNVTTTPTPTPLPGQTVLGQCSKILHPELLSVKYDLTTLTRSRLMCSS